MGTCERLRASVSRAADGEAGPDEAIRVARHVADCTSCRIVLARDRRLAEILERDLSDRLAVGEDFVRAVMATLPSGPPPRRKKGWRLLKLASLAALSLALPLGGYRLRFFQGSAVASSLPSPDLLAWPSFADGVLDDLSRLVLRALWGVSEQLPRLAAPFVSAPTFWARLGSAGLGLALLGASALALLAVAGLGRGPLLPPDCPAGGPAVAGQCSARRRSRKTEVDRPSLRAAAS